MNHGHQQVKLIKKKRKKRKKKKRWNNKDIFIENKYVHRKLKKGGGKNR